MPSELMGPDRAEVQQAIAGYKIGRLLHAGPQSTVFEGTQDTTGQRVAIKVYSGPAGEKSARAEVEVSVKLAHPHVVRVIDAGLEPGALPVVVLEFVDGGTLEQRLSEGPLAEPMALLLMGRILDALIAAHAAGVVHGDLKPANILLRDQAGTVCPVVADFGLSRGSCSGLSGEGLFSGTLAYANELVLCEGDSAERIDLVAWGLTFLECLTGRKPQGGNPADFNGRLREVRSRSIRAMIRSAVGASPTLVTANEVMTQIVQLSGAGGERPLEVGATRQCLLSMAAFALRPKPHLGWTQRHENELYRAARAACQVLAGLESPPAVSVSGRTVCAYFGLDGNREDDVARAVAAAEQVVSSVREVESIDVGVGVQWGRAIVEHERHGGGVLVVGDAVEEMIDLARDAAAGQVLLSPDAREVLRVSGRSAGGELAGDVFGEEGAEAGSPNGPAVAVDPSDRLPFVGREVEKSALLDGWRSIQEGGRSATFLVSGEAGLGKTRLLGEVCQVVAPSSRMQLRCRPESVNSPLAPVRESLGRIDSSLATYLEGLGLPLERSYALLAPLASLPEHPDYPPLSMTPEQQRDRTLAELQSLVDARARRGPLLVLVENIQWIDRTTAELVRMILALVERADGPSMMVVLSGRPSWFCEEMRGRSEAIELAPLTETAVAEMVRGADFDLDEAPRLVREILDRADGIPLFVEELVRMARANPTHSIAGVPASLQGVLTSQVDALSSDGRRVLSLVAVGGREMDAELVWLAWGGSGESLSEGLSELVRSGLLKVGDLGVGKSGYQFRHALIQEAVYELLDPAERRSLHARVGIALEESFPDLASRQPEVLAQHFANAGDIDRAAAYWNEASQNSIKSAFFEEAAGKAEIGLKLLDAWESGGAARHRRELELLTALGTAHFMRMGYAAPLVKETFERAEQVCDKLGGSLDLRVLNGLWSYYLARNDLERTQGLLPTMNELAEQEDPVLAFQGFAVLGANASYRGAFREAVSFARRARELFWTPEFQAYAKDYGYNGGIYCYTYEMTGLWYLGYPDQAQAVRRELDDAAVRAGDPYSLSIARVYGAILDVKCGFFEKAVEDCARQVDYSIENNLLLWIAAARCEMAEGLNQLERYDDALEQLEAGLQLYQMLGLEMTCSYYKMYRASAYLGAQRHDEALAEVDQALADCSCKFSRFQQLDLLRVKAEVLAATGDWLGSRHFYEQSVALARQWEARSSELHTLLSWVDHCESPAATEAVVADIATLRSQFSEGFGTSDLARAADLA